MKRSLILSAIFLFCFGLCSAYAFEVNVDIKGNQDLAAMKDGISKTITARCLAKNACPESCPQLNVSIMQLGDTVSFDAILDTKPQKAFHRDLKGTGELSSAIDQMIAEIFTVQPKTSAGGETPGAQKSSPAVRPEITLPFIASSFVIVNDIIYVSSEDSLYQIKNGKAVPYWKAPGTSTIFRLFAYNGAVLAVTGKTDSFFTYMIQAGKTAKNWNRCVVPFEGGLVASRLYADVDFSDPVNRWSKTESVEGSPVKTPEGMDILSMLVTDISPSAGGNETVIFNHHSHLVVLNGKETLWTSDTRFGTLPLYLTTKEKDPLNKNDFLLRYYINPRILQNGKDIITIQNDEGMTKMFGNVKEYDSSRILAYSPEESEFAERELAQIKSYYCADIALDKGKLLTLVVKKSTSFIQRIDL